MHTFLPVTFALSLAAALVDIHGAVFVMILVLAVAVAAAAALALGAAPPVGVQRHGFARRVRCNCRSLRTSTP